MHPPFPSSDGAPGCEWSGSSSCKVMLTVQLSRPGPAGCGSPSRTETRKALCRALRLRHSAARDHSGARMHCRCSVADPAQRRWRGARPHFPRPWRGALRRSTLGGTCNLQLGSDMGLQRWCRTARPLPTISVTGGCSSWPVNSSGTPPSASPTADRAIPPHAKLSTSFSLSCRGSF